MPEFSFGGPEFSQFYKCNMLENASARAFREIEKSQGIAINRYFH